MRTVLKASKWLGGLAVLSLAALLAWLYLAPPDLIRVGSGYAAKIVCSNVFLAGREPEEVLALDVQAPGHPLLRLMRVKVDREAGTVTAGLLGILGTSVAVFRDGLGCASVPDGNLARAKSLAGPPSRPHEAPDGLWPDGERVEAGHDPELEQLLDDPELAGEGIRAIVVVRNGRIVAERYGDGFSAATPLLGWSMTKTVTAAIVGTLVEDGRMALDRKELLPSWRGDGRADISIADLMAMASGLEFNEDYGDVTDVTRMLFLEPDMAAFAAAKPLIQPVGSVFSYSSGTTAILSRLWQDAIGDRKLALAWPRLALFTPLGMQSAVLEADAAGTFAGSSYMYATARDWARFGQFLLQEGMWRGRQILPPGFVAWMREPSDASPAYGRGHVWIEGEQDDASGSAPEVPPDTFWMQGHDGQRIAIIPSRQLVVVRMGLTPAKLGYQPRHLVAKVAKAAG